MQIRKHTARFCVIFLFLIFCLIIFSFKLTFIQIFRSKHLANLAKKQHNYLINLEPIRGAIYDRKLRSLAFNVTVSSLFANPRIMSETDKQKALKVLPGIINVDRSSLEKKLNKNKYFIWLARKLPAEATKQIKRYKINGLGFKKESKRYYPNQSLAAHIIGFAGTDNVGLEGIELQYNDFLKGKVGWSQILRDAKQRELLIEKNYVAPKDGLNLILTIDETIQYLAERALEEAFKTHQAKGGSIIIMDPKTGEILALANRPTYDLGQVSQSKVANRTNRAISFMYEPGSVFKIVTAAAALEERTFKENDVFYCENGSYRVANHILHDHRPHKNLTFREVFEQSSNIGVTKIAQKLGPEKVYEYAHKFRFGIPTGIDLAGEVRGVLKTPSQWSKTSIGAIPIGQEVTVTPLQLVCAISAIANKGVYMKPFVVKYIKDNNDQTIRSFEPEVLGKVISEETARRVTKILTGVVERGTGRRAQIKGVSIAGKTGTAQKVVNATYSHSKFYASFIGFAPADDPQVAVVVVFDEPHPSHYGGTVSAPVFKKVVEDVLKYLEKEE